MENISPLLDLPSPPNSYYLYREDQYIDTHASDSQSPINSHYDLSYVPDFTTIGDVYTSPEGEPDSPQEQETAPAPAKTPAKRKRENRYKNAPPSVLSRRRAQNRASQRAYRERKDQRIKDLEQMLNESKERNDVLSQAYMSLEAEYNKLKSQLAADPTAATSYAAAATAADLTATFDPASLGLGPTTAADDIFGYRYPDLTTYAHM